MPSILWMEVLDQAPGYIPENNLPPWAEWAMQGMVLAVILFAVFCVAEVIIELVRDRQD